MSTLQLNIRVWPVSAALGLSCRAVKLLCRPLGSGWSSGSMTPQGEKVPELGLQAKPECLLCNFVVSQPKSCEPKAADTGQLQVFEFRKTLCDPTPCYHDLMRAIMEYWQWNTHRVLSYGVIRGL